MAYNVKATYFVVFVFNGFIKLYTCLNVLDSFKCF